MPTASSAALAMFQSGGDVSAHDLHLLMIFVGFIALALMVAAIGMILMAGFAAKLLHSVDGIAKEVRDRTAPLLDKTHEMMMELSPKIHNLTVNAEHISETLRTKLDEVALTVTQINETAQSANLRTRAHVAHVDGIVSKALNAAEDISNTVQDGIRGPLRQVSGLLAGMRAGLEKLVDMSPFGRG